MALEHVSFHVVNIPVEFVLNWFIRLVAVLLVVEYSNNIFVLFRDRAYVRVHCSAVFDPTQRTPYHAHPRVCARCTLIAHNLTNMGML